MEETSTRVPAVVDALVARWTTDLDAQVIDGPPSAQDVRQDVILVGLPAEGGDSVTTQVERVQGLGHRYAETFSIWCLISSFTGDVTIKPRRDRCAALLAAAEGSLKADRALGGVCDLVSFGSEMTWSQQQTTEGAVCEVAFQVVGRAML